jgi:hypothetical protein
MALYNDIVAAVPTLTVEDFGIRGTIELRDDSDGTPPYIYKWDNALSLPKGFKLGK